MKMFNILTMILFLFVSCGAHAKESDIKDTPLQGKILGDVNGEAFTYFNEKERPGKIRSSNSNTSLNITFSTIPTLILTVNVRSYRGADTYNISASSKVLSLKNVKGVFKNKDDNKLTIIEDDDTHVKGSLSFATVSENDEDIVINATFDLTKVVIDPNDQQALLNEIKENPGSVASIGGLKADKDFMLKAISINQMAFNYADKSLKGDKGFILKALQENPKKPLLMFADKALKSDKDFALEAIKISDSAFYVLDRKLKKDKGFALKALKINPKVFNLLDKSLKKDNDIIAASKKK